MAPAFPLEYTGLKESERCSFSQLMGKSREYFKGGNRSGFIPDYRHAVETMGESEGIGSSGRIDTEMTASEGSCAPKRKCIGLNADSYNNFGVPMQALLLSKMSQSERKNLELRLKMELEQVRLLQKKVASLGSRLDFLSASTGVAVMGRRCLCSIILIGLEHGIHKVRNDLLEDIIESTQRRAHRDGLNRSWPLQ